MFRSPKNPSVMGNRFSQTPQADIPRSTFNLSHGHKTTFDSGDIVPIGVWEALPGDTWSIRLSSICRLSTPLVPLMDNMHLDFFFFSVPNRLVWDNWPKFMGEQVDPGDSTDYTVPKMTLHAASAGDLEDHFGLPTAVNMQPISLFHRAHNLIHNEWFRDENLQDSLTVDTGDGPDSIANYTLNKRGKRHDYFTSCLPWPQKGTEVDMPLGTTAPVIGSGKSLGLTDGTNAFSLRQGADNKVITDQAFYYQNLGATPTVGSQGLQDTALGVNTGASASGLIADLSTATAATINSLREAFMLQGMMERDARSGTRYCEVLQAHFLVTDPMNAVLQRPEYLGGGSRPIEVQAIPQTSAAGATGTTTPQGNLAAMALNAQSGISMSKSFTEHSMIFCYVNARADITYQRGMDRMWNRSTKYDYYWPALAGLGEQEVLNKEIYMNADANDDLVFGYQERWAEYRFQNSKITGTLRSNHAQSLDVWHLSQDFSSLPALNSAFITEDPPIDRVVAVTTEPEFIFDGYFQISATRPMPTYSVPGMGMKF